MFQYSNTAGLFGNFEVNREPFWPRVRLLLAGSIVWHLVIILVIVMVPQVRDTLAIATIFSDSSFVDRPYDKTEIENLGEITELTTEKFHYPEGYFQMDQVPIPSPTPTPTPLAFASAPFTPAPVPPTQLDPVVVPSPSSTASPLVASNATPTPSPADRTAEQAQTDLDRASKASGIDLPKEDEINKRPLKDWVVYASDLSKQNKLDLNQPFEVVIEGDLDQNGKLKNLKFTKQAGNFDVTDLGGKLIAALNDSGLLIYLKKLNEDNPGTHVVFTIKQGNDQIATSVESESSSAKSASTLAFWFRVMLAAGAKTRAGKNEEVYLKNTTVSANDKKITFGLTLPRQTVIDMLKKEIASAAETASPAP